MEDAVRLNVNPPTLQRASRPELKFQGAAIVTEAPTLTNAVKLPDRLTTVGGAPFPLSQPVTWVAVLTEVVLRCAPPLIVMVPVIGAAVAVGVAVAVASGCRKRCRSCRGKRSRSCRGKRSRSCRGRLSRSCRGKRSRGCRRRPVAVGVNVP